MSYWLSRMPWLKDGWAFKACLFLCWKSELLSLNDSSMLSSSSHNWLVLIFNCLEVCSLPIKHLFLPVFMLASIGIPRHPTSPEPSTVQLQRCQDEAAWQDYAGWVVPLWACPKLIEVYQSSLEVCSFQAFLAHLDCFSFFKFSAVWKAGICQLLSVQVN